MMEIVVKEKKHDVLIVDIFMLGDKKMHQCFSITYTGDADLWFVLYAKTLKTIQPYHFQYT